MDFENDFQVRLVEWVPGRYWLLKARKTGFMPICEVTLALLEHQLKLLRYILYVVGKDKMEQGLQVVKQEDDFLFLSWDGGPVRYDRVCSRCGYISCFCKRGDEMGINFEALREEQKGN